MNDINSSFKKIMTLKFAFWIYGAIGSIYYFYISKSQTGSMAYFLLGWAVSYINFELQRKGMGMLVSFLTADGVRRAPPALYMVLLLKLVFLGIVIAFLVISNNVLVVPFLFGMASLLFAVFILGLRVFISKKPDNKKLMT